MARDERPPAALEKRPARPKHHRRAQDELRPDDRRAPERGKRSRSPGTNSPIDSTSTGTVSARPIQKRRVMSRSSAFSSSGVALAVHRLQRHAADRARAGMILPDFRMHGAGVDGALGVRRKRDCVPAPCRTWGTRRACRFPPRRTSGRNISPSLSAAGLPYDGDGRAPHGSTSDPPASRETFPRGNTKGSPPAREAYPHGSTNGLQPEF